MSTSESARCTDDVKANGNWKKVTSQGQIDVSKPNRALRIDNETEAGFASFSSLGGSSVRSVDFWLKIEDDVDNGTIIGWGDNSTAGGEFVIISKTAWSARPRSSRRIRSTTATGIT